MYQRIVLSLVALLCSLSLSATSLNADSTHIAAGIKRMLALYPESTLIDIYKSCFQDAFGPGHIIPSEDAARKYLSSELPEAANTNPAYEPTGIDGNYIRVNLTAVADGRIGADTLVRALIDSAVAVEPAYFDAWVDRWHTILAVVEGMDLGLPDFDADKEAIEQRLAQGIYVGHHSERYSQAYRPHYRIISRDIFFLRILPLLH